MRTHHDEITGVLVCRVDDRLVGPGVDSLNRRASNTRCGSELEYLLKALIPVGARSLLILLLGKPERQLRPTAFQVGVTVIAVTAAPRALARASPLAAALSEHSDPSIAMRICRYIVILR
jgi:hypothetical protein